MRKKLLSLALALVMCLSLMPCAFAAETADKFTDVPADAWYKAELDYAVFNGYISGVGDNKFSPDGTLTRGQFVTILGRLVYGDFPSSLYSNRFVDVDAGAYYAKYVIWADAEGLVSGTSSTTFSPDAPVTVEQMGTIIAKYLNKTVRLNYDVLVPSAEYKDASSISSWAKEGMEVMRQCDLLATDASGNVNPQKSATRAECAVTIVRLAKILGLGVVPVNVQKTDTAEVAAKKIHDALWSAGWINSAMTQQEKAGVYFEWLAGACDYDLSLVAPNVGTAYGALVNGLAVCEGYTSGYNLLLETEGIDCSMVIAFDHAWTAATLDGVLYHIDVTWGDQVTWINYEYFCMTPEWSMLRHDQEAYYQYLVDQLDSGELNFGEPD